MVEICVILARGNVATAEDVVLAEKTFAPDMGGLKGKTTRSRPLAAQSEAMEIPR